jgi:hypothetical protein
MKAGGYRYIYVYKRQINMAKYEEGNDTRWNDEYICDMYESWWILPSCIVAFFIFCHLYLSFIYIYISVSTSFHTCHRYIHYTLNLQNKGLNSFIDIIKIFIFM